MTITTLRDLLFALAVIALLELSRLSVIATIVHACLYALLMVLIAIDYAGVTLVGGGPLVGRMLSHLLPAAAVCELLLVPTRHRFLGLLETGMFLLLVVQCSGAFFWEGVWSERRRAYGAWLMIAASLTVALRAVTPREVLAFIGHPASIVIAAFGAAVVLLVYATLSVVEQETRRRVLAALAACVSLVLALVDLLGVMHRLDVPRAFATIAAASCVALYIVARLFWTQPVPRDEERASFIPFTFALAFLLTFTVKVYSSDVRALLEVMRHEQKFELWLVIAAAVMSIGLTALLTRFRRSEDSRAASAPRNGRRSRTAGRSSAPAPRARDARSFLPR